MLDALGHPITKGCTVLTGGYWSPTMSDTTKVLKTTKSKVHVEVEGYIWDAEARKYNKQRKIVSRWPHQVVVVDAQIRSNRRKYPEHII